MKKTFRFTILVLALLMMLCSCNGEVETVSKDPVSDTSDVTQTPQKLLLYQEKIFDMETETYYYDSYGVLTESKIESADGQVLTCKYAYDASGNKISETTYEENGEVREESKWTYNEKGLLVEFVDGRMMQTTKYTYDDQNRISTHIENDKYLYYYTYDEDGNYTVQPDGYMAMLYYTKDGELYKIYDNNGDLATDSEFDENGNMVTQTNYADGEKPYFVSNYEYNDNNQVIKQTYYNNDKLSGTTVYEYDEFGNLLKIKSIDPLGKETVSREYVYKYFPVEEKE